MARRYVAWMKDGAGGEANARTNISGRCGMWALNKVSELLKSERVNIPAYMEEIGNHGRIELLKVMYEDD